MSNLFHEILYRPLFNALIFLYQHLSFYDLGVAIIFLTIIIRLILFPLFYKGAKDQAIIQYLAPKIKQIQTDHKNDREKQTKEILNLYRQHKVNPFSSFLLLFIQIPILIALYQVFLKGFSVDSLKDLYSFITPPVSLNYLFLGIIDLSKRNIFIIIIATIIQYFQAKLSSVKTNKPFKDLNAAERMNRQMVYLGPILTFIFLYGLNLPSAIGLYWLTTSTFSVIQQIVINSRININYRNSLSENRK